MWTGKFKLIVNMLSSTWVASSPSLVLHWLTKSKYEYNRKHKSKEFLLANTTFIVIICPWTKHAWLFRHHHCYYPFFLLCISNIGITCNNTTLQTWPQTKFKTIHIISNNTMWYYCCTFSNKISLSFLFTKIKTINK